MTPINLPSHATLIIMEYWNPESDNGPEICKECAPNTEKFLFATECSHYNDKKRMTTELLTDLAFFIYGNYKKIPDAVVGRFGYHYIITDENLTEREEVQQKA